MDKAREKRILEAAAATLDERLAREGFVRAPNFNSGKGMHRIWERRMPWKRETLSLVNRYGSPGHLIGNVHTDVVFEDGTTIGLHGTNIGWYLHQNATWPPAGKRLLLSAASDDRYAAWIVGECIRALSFFERGKTPADAADWLADPERNGTPAGTPQHARMLQRLASVRQTRKAT